MPRPRSDAETADSFVTFPAKPEENSRPCEANGSAPGGCHHYRGPALASTGHLEWCRHELACDTRHHSTRATPLRGQRPALACTEHLEWSRHDLARDTPHHSARARSCAGNGLHLPAPAGARGALGYGAQYTTPLPIREFTPPREGNGPLFPEHRPLESSTWNSGRGSATPPTLRELANLRG